MIMSAADPRDERFHAFLREAERAAPGALPVTARIDGVDRAARAVAEAVEVRSPPELVAPWAIELGGWALSPDPAALEPWAFASLRRLRRDPVRARNVTRGVVDWVLGELRTRVSELRESWQAVHDASLGYPLDARRRLEHPAQASAEVAVWSYALLRALVAQWARGLPALPTTLAEAARARTRRGGELPRFGAERRPAAGEEAMSGKPVGAGPNLAEKAGAMSTPETRIEPTFRETPAPARPAPSVVDDYPEWSKDALYARAKELGIPGRSDMSKSQLIEAIRRR